MIFVSKFILKIYNKVTRKNWIYFCSLKWIWLRGIMCLLDSWLDYCSCCFWQLCRSSLFAKTKRGRRSAIWGIWLKINILSRQKWLLNFVVKYFNRNFYIIQNSRFSKFLSQFKLNKFIKNLFRKFKLFAKFLHCDII